MVEFEVTVVRSLMDVISLILLGLKIVRVHNDFIATCGTIYCLTSFISFYPS